MPSSLIHLCIILKMPSRKKGEYQTSHSLADVLGIKTVDDAKWSFHHSAQQTNHIITPGDANADNLKEDDISECFSSEEESGGDT
jgi:hypothetical protein